MATSPASHGTSGDDPLKVVIRQDYCIGCGACAAVSGSPYRMMMMPDGRYLPQAQEGLGKVGWMPVRPHQVCPFHEGPNEDVLGQALYAPLSSCHHPDVGYYDGLYAATVVHPHARMRSSSGGMATWLLRTLKAQGLIDGVIHVGRGPGGAEPLFQYQLSTTGRQIREAAGSRYYPVEFSGVLNEVRKRPARYAFVGVPCYIKALRLLAREDDSLRRSIAYTVGLFCGHMKTAAYAEYLAWQLGVQPGELAGIDFRCKSPKQPANRYGLRVWDIWGWERTAPMAELFGSDWGWGLFKPKACDYCDDVAAELADVTCGDAWLPEYVHDGRGTNIVVVRHPELHQLMKAGEARGVITLQALQPGHVRRSQAANYRHRHQGLAFRLWLVQRAGDWHPPKRITPPRGTGVGLWFPRGRLYRQRLTLSRMSHRVYGRARSLSNLGYVRRQLAPEIALYERLRRPMWRRILGAWLRNLRVR